jgi:hypothetical protein
MVSSIRQTRCYLSQTSPSRQILGCFSPETDQESRAQLPSSDDQDCLESGRISHAEAMSRPRDASSPTALGLSQLRGHVLRIIASKSLPQKRTIRANHVPVANPRISHALDVGLSTKLQTWEQQGVDGYCCLGQRATVESDYAGRGAGLSG